MILSKWKNFTIKYFNTTYCKKHHNSSKNFTAYFLDFKRDCRFELMHRPDKSINNNDKTNEYLGIIHLKVSVGSKEKVNALTE